MATPIKDHSLASHSGTVDDIQLAGIVSCKSVQFESSDGTPGLRCTSASGEESWTPVAVRSLSGNKFATATDQRLPGACHTGSVTEFLVWRLGRDVQEVGTCSSLGKHGLLFSLIPILKFENTRSKSI